MPRALEKGCVAFTTQDPDVRLDLRGIGEEE